MSISTATGWTDGRPACHRLDYNALQNEEPTFAAVTSRSYHSGGVVNVAMMDGSVKGVSGDIDLLVWRAASTRDGGEVTTLEQ